MFFINNHKKRIKQLLILVSILLIIICLAIFYLSNQKKDTPVEKEVYELTIKVGKLIELPKDETPTVATVLDEERVRGEVFFKEAKNGDKLLAYIKNRKAILYRPSSNKIIEVAPISFDQAK